MKTKTILLLCLLLGISCNKTKRYANRLDGQHWKVKELSVDGNTISPLPEIEFMECDIYKEDCKGEWHVGNSGHAEFIWQIRDKGKTLILSNQSSEDHAHTIEDINAVNQCISFSGTYSIKVSKKNRMEAESYQTIGYSGKKVYLKMEK